MTPYERLLLPENLYYAWRKAKRLYQMSDGYIDSGELLNFELDLENRLKKIERQFKKGKYKLQPIRPLPRPKKVIDKQYVDRQYYHISVDDQVAWIAVVNALGPEIDEKMPAWSYGNRLYRPAWYEENQDSKLEIGPYRHASGNLYKKFQHSWPIFRKHISLTARAMVQDVNKNEQSEGDQRAIEAAEKEGLPYLRNEFWIRPSKNTVLYHASIDLKQFYPSISAEHVLFGLTHISDTEVIEVKLSSLLKSMLNFTLDNSDLPHHLLKNVEPRFGKKNVQGLPTGLFAAGFLANAAMLKVDEIVDDKINSDHTVAHFRFVDDHTILTYEFDKLCEWIEWYKKLVKKHICLEVNDDKTDPKSLSDWLSPTIEQELYTSSKSTLRKNAIAECEIDGTNPTKLLTKTLEKVSIIAGQDSNVLDDNDLNDRLKDLEWLLLADIPEREIRPDTRAAFAAGQIATLAPMLIHGTDGIVDLERKLIKIKNELKSLQKHPDENKKNIQKLKEIYRQQETSLTAHQNRVIDEEKRHLTRCFDLLMHAMKEHPGKARLFFRLHQYCLLTGHHGIGQINQWINELRIQEAYVWADYYCCLTLQLLAKNILKALRVYSNPSSLRSDQQAAKSYLEDIGSINKEAFRTNAENESWFHKMARHEYEVSIVIAAKFLKLFDSQTLSSSYSYLAELNNAPSWKDNSIIWLEKTGYSSGTWAYLAEKSLRSEFSPTCIWKSFESTFDYSNVSDQHVIRLYPELLTNKTWEYLVNAETSVKEDDSGWLFDIIKNKDEWISASKNIHNTAFNRAANVASARQKESKTHITIAEWTRYLKSNDCSAFDPRRSEWTALEIIRQLVEPQLEFGNRVPLHLTHPQNILIPITWKIKENDITILSWETWRAHINNSNQKVIFSKEKNSLMDYRYNNYKNNLGDRWHKREGQLAAVGRLLLGLIDGNHVAPVEWNIRGNERVIDIPRARIFRSLAISSPTLLIIEGCIAPRSKETRLIYSQPGLFGLNSGEQPNDINYDPPVLEDEQDLINAIRSAQIVLEENQLAVSLHQPRQLIPFRIVDFAASKDNDLNDENDAQG